MDLVDAMRKGKVACPKAEEISDEILSIKDNKIIGFCAVGAVAVGALGEEFSVKAFKAEPRGMALIKLLAIEFPQLMREIKSPITKLYKYIWYLNDIKGLTIHQIADRLEKRGLK